eukprot:8010470-Karenia_brevis.AAC.1
MVSRIRNKCRWRGQQCWDHGFFTLELIETESGQWLCVAPPPSSCSSKPLRNLFPHHAQRGERL